jgi:tripartite-type tricarboxylate transporter receptor subunit TctC
MKPPRRRFLQLAGSAAAALSLTQPTLALEYPTRPVHVIVGYAAGSGADIVARLLGQWLSEHLGQPFVIENRPGAGSSTAPEAVVRARPDGYTLLWVTAANAIGASLYDKLTYNLIRDIAPIAGATLVPNVMEVNPSVPARTVPEFIVYAKANPDKISMASSGNGTAVHLSGELFKMMIGVAMIHVPYRSTTSALTDLLAGQVQLMFDNPLSSIQHIRSGRLRALAVTTATRLDALPDVPTVGEFVPGYVASGWQGIGAPMNTPTEIVDKLNRAIGAALTDPQIDAQLAELGAPVLVRSPADFGKLIADETEKWAKVVKFSGAKPD